jgi:hypothetical protein
LNEPERFSASEIAAGIERTSRQVIAALGGTPPSGSKMIGGNVVPAWALGDFPPLLFAEIQRRQKLFCYRSAEDVLRNPTKRWEPPIPLSKIRAEDVEEALKLKQSLENALASSSTSSVMEMARIAHRDYERAFGVSKSERQFRRLIPRIIERDRGAGEFKTRVELYLSDSARAAVVPRQCRAVESTGSFEELDIVLSGIGDAAPSEEDRESVWNCICRSIAEQLDSGEDETRIKGRLVDHLWKAAPAFSKSRDALARNIRRLWATYCTEGRINSGRKGRGSKLPPDWEYNIDLTLRYVAAKRGCPEAQAWRELYMGTVPAGVEGFKEGQRYTEPFREYYKYDWRRAKSRVPRRVMKEVAARYNSAEHMLQGESATRLNRSSVPLDYSDTTAGEVWSADDKTPDLYHWVLNQEGGKYIAPAGWRFDVLRGQLLAIVDDRSDCPIGFSLLSKPSYNANDIKTLLAKTWMDPRWGMPKICKFEGGIWRARDLKDIFTSEERRAGAFTLPWTKIENAFGAEGVKLRWIMRPEGKVIERVFGSHDKQLSHLRGWVGNDERRRKIEGTHGLLNSFKLAETNSTKKAVDPREWLLDAETLKKEIAAAFERFANEPQNGERNHGKSPRETFDEFRGSRPAIVPPESLRYLLATNQSIQKVSHEGIKIRGEYYRGSSQLGAMQGRHAEVYYDPERPQEVIVIDRERDPSGLAPFAVPMCPRIPANTATKAQLRLVNSHTEAFLAPGKATARALHHIFNPPRSTTIQDENFGTANVRETGARIEEEKQKARRNSNDREKRLSRSKREAAGLLSELLTEHSRKSEQEPLAP